MRISLLFFCTSIIIAIIIFFSGGAHILTLQVVNVAFIIKEILLLITLYLNAFQAFCRKLLRVVHIDDIVAVIFLSFNFFSFISFFLDFETLRPELNYLALSQIFKVKAFWEAILIKSDLVFSKHTTVC